MIHNSTNNPRWESPYPAIESWLLDMDFPSFNYRRIKTRIIKQSETIMRIVNETRWLCNCAVLKDKLTRRNIEGSWFVIQSIYNRKIYLSYTYNIYLSYILYKFLIIKKKNYYFFYTFHTLIWDVYKTIEIVSFFLLM